MTFELNSKLYLKFIQKAADVISNCNTEGVLNKSETFRTFFRFNLKLDKYIHP